MSFGSKSFARAYQNIGAETSLVDADPHRIIELLFDAAIAAVNSSRDALAARDVARRSQSIGKAIRIVQEGLQASLNLSSGQIANNLHRLYEYICLRLLTANRDSDESPLIEVTNLLQQLRSGWAGIAPAQGARS